MKKSIMIIAVLAFFTQVFAARYAQDAGSYQLGGNFGFESKGGDLYKNADDDRETTITISPELSYFLIEGLSFGVKMNYTRTSQGDVTNTDLGFGPALSFYLGNSRSIVYPYLTGAYFFNSDKMKMKTAIGDQEIKSNSQQIYLGAGALYMVSNAVGMNIELFYRIDKTKPDGGESRNVNVFGIMVGFQSFIF